PCRASRDQQSVDGDQCHEREHPEDPFDLTEARTVDRLAQALGLGFCRDVGQGQESRRRERIRCSARFNAPRRTLDGERPCEVRSRTEVAIPNADASISRNPTMPNNTLTLLNSSRTKP